MKPLLPLNARAWPFLPWYVRACLRGMETYCRAFGWCGFGLRESAVALRYVREELPVGEWLLYGLQAQREHDAADHADPDAKQPPGPPRPPR